MKKYLIIGLACLMCFGILPANALVPVEKTDVALNAPVNLIAGSAKVGELNYLVDGNPDTYWESVAEGWNCFCIDLGKEYDIQTVKVRIPEEVSSSSPAYFTVFLTNTATGGHLGDVVAEPVIANEQTPASGAYEYPLDLDRKFRYVKIQNVSGNTFGFSDIEVIADAEKLELLDVAKGKDVQMNAGASLEGTPEETLDGNGETYWMSQATFTVLQIDLGREYEIAKIETVIPQTILDRSEGCYTVGLSNTAGGQDAVWSETKLAPSVGGNIHNIGGAQTFRYIKFMSYSGVAYGFSEVRVYVKDPYFGEITAMKGTETVSDLSGGVDRIEVEITDNRDTAETFMLLAVLYDSEGRMIDSRATEAMAERGKWTLQISVDGWEFTEGQTLRTALVNTLQDMHLFQKVHTLPFRQ